MATKKKPTHSRSGTVQTKAERRARGKRRIEIEMDEGLLEALDALCSISGRNRSEAIRDLLLAAAGKPVKKSG